MLLLITMLMLVALPAAFAAQRYGPIRPGETLWRVAEQTKANADQSTAQTAVAIWENNLDAFQNNNMYGLMAGYKLVLPSHALIGRLSHAQAVRIVAQQALAWEWSKQKALRSEEKETWLRRDANYKQSLSLALFQTNLYHLQHMQKKLLHLKDHIHTMSQSMHQRDQALLAAPADRPPIDAVPRWFLYTLEMFAIGFMVLLLTVSIAWLRRRKHAYSAEKNKAVPSAHVSHTENAVDDEGEYNFLASQEGLATQLDLGRAYIAMDDPIAAKKALNNVLQQGDDAQKEQAKALLATLSS